MNTLRRLMLTGAVLGCVSLGGLALGEAPTWAVSQYPLVGEISSAAAPGGEFKHGATSLALDGENAIVGSNNSLDVFGPTGELQWFLDETNAPVSSQGLRGVAVNEGTGAIYVSDESNHVVDVFSSTGTYLSQINGEGAGKPVPNGLKEPGALAVDRASGEVYVFDRDEGHEAIDVFSAMGEYLFRIASAGGSGLGRYVDGMAVDDSTGSLLVGDGQSKESVVYVFNAATGVYSTTWSGANTPQKAFVGEMVVPAVDDATGAVYVAASGLPLATNTKPGVVDRFTAAGEYENQIKGSPTEVFPGEYEAAIRVAVNQTNDDVYVLAGCKAEYPCKGGGGKHGLIYIFAGNPVAVPHVSVEEPSNVKPTSVTLRGVVNPEETGEATCEFEYGATPSYGQRMPCKAPVANGSGPVAVEAELAGLKSDTTYYYRLDGKNVADGDTNAGEDGEAVGQFTTSGPRLVAEGVAGVKGEVASFEATIVPNGVPTSAYFQYGTSEAYGISLPAPPGAPLGAGSAEAQFTRQATGLQPDTVYHYRLVVMSELQPGSVEAVYGPDRTLTTQPAAAPFALPDGRAWELVTPAEKYGALIFGQSFGHFSNFTQPLVAEASMHGDAMMDLASAPTEAEPPGNADEAAVLSTRGPGGWSSQVIAAPHNSASGPSIGLGGEYVFYSEDLSRAVVDPSSVPFTPLSPEASEPTPYLRTDYVNGSVGEPCRSSCYRPLVTRADTQSGVAFGEENAEGLCPSFTCGPKFVDATPDASYVALNSSMQLTSTPFQAGTELFYEWGNGGLQPLYLLPAAEGGVGVDAGKLVSAAHQLASNGSVFFTYGEHLYLHDFARDMSVRLDVAQGITEPAAGAPKFLYAASDGSRVLFSDAAHLTSAGRGGIYDCRIVEAGGVPGCELSLTPLAGGLLLNGSRDATYLYFEDPEEKLVVGHDEGGRWSTTVGPYIGSLPQGEELAGFGATGTAGSEASPVTETSPDGRYLTFMSDQELTGYDNHDAVNGRPDVEVYLYDAVANRLVCASCDPSGARPVGTELHFTDLVAGSLPKQAGLWTAASLPPWTVANGSESRYEPRFLSDSGRLFFNSRDALVPQDVNGQQDVYEFEPPGVGSCTTARVAYSGRSGGCVSLISAGASAEESAFMDASEGGGDVFFITLSRLTSQDFDNALDVYDAHECTPASPCPSPVVPTPPPCATGDGCKPAPTPQPSIFGAPASATFTGSGNVAAAGQAAGGGSANSRSLTRAQKLSRALRACGKARGRRRRAACERSAHRRYGKAGASRTAGVRDGRRGR